MHRINATQTPRLLGIATGGINSMPKVLVHELSNLHDLRSPRTLPHKSYLETSTRPSPARSGRLLELGFCHLGHLSIMHTTAAQCALELAIS
ncbi:uncharacterized protein MYCFIDRAFT_210276 [Pseudocercospora fijiensis CIRAD86]|uniref:Uncharacterized protein n=1 Tax=Pseudocercospora fijiensis (strain CIRAD86) TaxID=383855 RepID=M2Z736_PSEFD|nr:uncharacterized protein MYCFIDRAFT_210276 [Pseudocercospora fijiensis CIRAD86]EME85600.1 hypothetical protein MYCFIDRAFT_210276 [Pseudocercospora fijiensis CIRAD86]